MNTHRLSNHALTHRRRQSSAIVAAYQSRHRISIYDEDNAGDGDGVGEDDIFTEPPAKHGTLAHEAYEDTSTGATEEGGGGGGEEQEESDSTVRNLNHGTDEAEKSLKHQSSMGSSIFRKGLLKTSLRLIDEKAQNLDMIESMLLPLLDQLISSTNSNSQHIGALIEAHKWALSRFATGSVSLPGSSRNDVRLCGWLGKLGRSGTKIQRRWVELSGQTLSYFADSNGLEMRGCLDLEGCLCRPLPPTNRGRFSFELASEAGKVIKKVHSRTDGKYKQKKSYRFCVATEDELSMWTVAIQEAINQPELRRVKETCARFAKINDSEREEYMQVLRDISVSAFHSHPFIFPCDWLHQQVLLRNFSVSEGPIPENRHEAKNLDQVYKDFVRDTVLIDGTCFECEDGDVIIEYLFGQIYEKYARFHGLDDEVASVSQEHTTRKRIRLYRKLMDHHVMKNCLTYARAVLMASCRTVSGGDTYDAVDFMLRKDGLSVICPDSGFVSPVKISVCYPDSKDVDAEDYSDSPDHRGEDVVFDAGDVGNANQLQKKESLLKKISTSMPRLRSSSAASSSKKKGAKTGMFKSMSSYPAVMPNHSQDSRHVQVDNNGQSKLSALRTRFQGSGKNLLESSKAKSSRSFTGTESIDDLEEELDSMRWPDVRVDVEAMYKVMDADPIGDDPTLARIHTTFSRTFSWGRHTYCKPGEVSVQVLRQNAQETDRATSRTISTIDGIPEEEMDL